MSIIFAGQKLVNPTRHMWVRAIQELERSTPSQKQRNNNLNILASSPSSNSSWIVDVGLTNRALEDIGDMTSMRALIAHHHIDHQDNERIVKKGQDILDIEWDGHMITAADELYHTMWETFSETTRISTPISGHVQSLTILPATMALDSETILFQLRTDYESLRDVSHELVEECDYEEMVNQDPPGRFAES